MKKFYKLHKVIVPYQFLFSFNILHKPGVCWQQRREEILPATPEIIIKE